MTPSPCRLTQKSSLKNLTLVVKHITSINEPELEAYRTLKRPLLHQQQGFFVAEGEKVVRRLIESSLHITSLLLTEEWCRQYHDALQKRPELVVAYVAEKKLLEEIVGFQLHKGVMAVAVIPKSESIEIILSRSTRPFCLVAVDGIMNAENLGVIVRNCASFGVDALLVGETSCDPYLRRVVRNSMGTIFSLPVVRLQNIVEDLGQLRNSFNIRLIAADPNARNADLAHTDLSRDCCVVFGSEGDGISAKVREICDAASAIPMNRGVDSINVSSASAVFLYELMRQRNGGSTS